MLRDAKSEHFDGDVKCISREDISIKRIKKLKRIFGLNDISDVVLNELSYSPMFKKVLCYLWKDSKNRSKAERENRIINISTATKRIFRYKDMLIIIEKIIGGSYKITEAYYDVNDSDIHSIDKDYIHPVTKRFITVSDDKNYESEVVTLKEEYNFSNTSANKYSITPAKVEVFAVNIPENESVLEKVGNRAVVNVNKDPDMYSHNAAFDAEQRDMILKRDRKIQKYIKR